MATKTINILGIDYGEARVGVARVNSFAKLPEPLGILKNDDNLVSSVLELIKEHDISVVVVGLPRNMSGQETAQSEQIRAWTAELMAETDLPIKFSDETLSSHAARERSSAKHIDDEAAVIILEDYLRSSDV